MTQPEALRLADWLLDWLRFNAEPSDLEAAFVGASAELRRLYAENEKKSEAIQRLWKERDELRDSNEAKADRIDRLGETVEKLKAERDELLEALRNISIASQDSGSAREGSGSYARAAVKSYALDAIAKAEGKT